MLKECGLPAVRAGTISGNSETKEYSGIYHDGYLVPGDVEWVCIQVTLDSGSARLAVFIVAASWSRTELGLIGSFVLMAVGSLAMFTHSLRTELDLNGKAKYTAIPSAIDGSDVRL